jgi:hypothetical protein
MAQQMLSLRHMKNNARTASTILGLFLVLTGSKASAILITDVRTMNAMLNSGNPTYDSVANNNSFDLTTHGFTPGSQTVSAAYASFNFLDTDLISDIARVNLNGSLLTIGATFPIGFSAFGGSLVGTVLADLSATGKLDYTVTLQGNSSATLLGASLTADVTDALTGNPIGNAVPDGGSTLTLLGCAMLGLGWLRKRLIA